MLGKDPLNIGGQHKLHASRGLFDVRELQLRSNYMKP